LARTFYGSVDCSNVCGVFAGVGIGIN